MLLDAVVLCAIYVYLNQAKEAPGHPQHADASEVEPAKEGACALPSSC